MTEMSVQVSSNNISKSSLTFDTRNAWASYVRIRWSANTLCHIQDEWDLSEGEARGLLYAQASQRTIDKINDHKNGGFMLALDVLCIRFKTTLEAVAARMEEQNAHDRLSRQAGEERRRAALRSLESLRRLDREDGV